MLSRKNGFIRNINRDGKECTVVSREIVKPDGSIGAEYIVRTGADDEHFENMMDEEKSKVLAWLRANALPPEEGKHSRPHLSYGMKKVLERRTNVFLTNNQFKEVMLCLGFYPKKVDEQNWSYDLHRKSPIFKEQSDHRTGLYIPECWMDYHRRQR